jgi:hypothetical protein
MRRLKLTEACQQRFIKTLSVSLPVFVFASLVGSAWGQESVNIVDFNGEKSRAIRLLLPKENLSSGEKPSRACRGVPCVPAIDECRRLPPKPTSGRRGNPLSV